jgi:hypothetical protein
MGIYKRSAFIASFTVGRPAHRPLPLLVYIPSWLIEAAGVFL